MKQCSVEVWAKQLFAIIISFVFFSFTALFLNVGV